MIPTNYLSKCVIFYVVFSSFDLQKVTTKETIEKLRSSRKKLYITGNTPIHDVSRILFMNHRQIRMDNIYIVSLLY